MRVRVGTKRRQKSAAVAKRRPPRKRTEQQGKKATVKRTKRKQPPPPPPAPPEAKVLKVVDAIERRQLINLGAKAKEGKVLTVGESKMLGELRAKHEAAAADAVCATMKSLAAALDVTERTVYRWKTDKSFPEEVPGGGHSLAAVRAWRDDQAGGGELKAEETRWKIEFRKAKTRLAELELQIKEGEFVPAADHKRQMQQLVLASRGAIMSIPSLASQLEGLPAVEIRGILKQATNEVLARLAGE